MPKKKSPNPSVRLGSDIYGILKEIAEKNPLRPSIAQLIGKLVRTHSHTLREDNRPG